LWQYFKINFIIKVQNENHLPTSKFIRLQSAPCMTFRCCQSCMRDWRWLDRLYTIILLSWLTLFIEPSVYKGFYRWWLSILLYRNKQQCKPCFHSFVFLQCVCLIVCLQNVHVIVISSPMLQWFNCLFRTIITNMHGIILCHSLRMIFNFGEFIERIDNLNINYCMRGWRLTNKKLSYRYQVVLSTMFVFLYAIAWRINLRFSQKLKCLNKNAYSYSGGL